MPSHRCFRSWIGLALALVLLAPPAFAKNFLMTYGERVTVYTGPGKFYRPLVVLPSGTEIQYSPKIIKTKKGDFYKVIVKLSDKKTSKGYLPVESEARPVSAAVESGRKAVITADELESFVEYPLAKRSIQFSGTRFKTQRSLATLGLMKFIGPGFYLKGFGGAFLSPGRASQVAGFELGNDALLHRSLSGYISYALGLFLKPKENALFVGNKNDFSNFLVQTAIGLRYNFGETAALSVGATQAALFSANNSLVTWGGIFTIEWGL